MQSVLIIFLGAGIGGVFRHLLNAWISRIVGTEFPWGILGINILGSLAMGAVIAWLASRDFSQPQLALFLTTGILGGFTTFSAFSLDVALLYERGEILQGAAYAAASVVFSVLALIIGMWMVKSLS